MKLFIVLAIASLSWVTPKVEYSTNVYICVSTSSEVYHSKKDCSGIKNCIHEVREISENDAIHYYGRRKCKKCY